jgi:hypothetical protein
VLLTLLLPLSGMVPRTAATRRALVVYGALSWLAVGFADFGPWRTVEWVVKAGAAVLFALSIWVADRAAT